MNGKPFQIKAFLLLLLLSGISCQRMYEGDEEEQGEDISQTHLPLKVSARSSGDSPINYPAYIYAFTEDGNCAASQKMKDDGQIEMKLQPARYTVVAIAGPGEEYIIPETPCLDDVIVMKENNRSSRALMMGTSTVTVATKKNTSVSITLYYAVSLVNVTLEDIPSSARKVRLQISPLYSSLSFTGEYSGKGNNTEITCEQETGGTWTAKPFYIFPGNSSQTIFSITLEDDSRTKTFGYTFKGKPEANVPMNIGGSYSGDVTVGGSLISGEWKEPVDVNFSFGGSVEGGKEDENPPVIDPGLSGPPEMKTIWQGGIVAGIENTGDDGANVLLMGLNGWEDRIANIREIIKEEEKDGWHLPDEEEAKALHAAFKDSSLDEVNERMGREGYGDLLDIEKRYVYEHNGSIYAFGFKSSSKFLQAGSTVKYGIRLVRTIRYEASH